MNSRERVLGLLNHQAIDRVPVAPFVMAFAARFAGIPYRKYCTNYKFMAEAQVKTVSAFDYDIVTADTDAYREAEACGAILEFQEDGLPLEAQSALEDKNLLIDLKLPKLEESRRMYDKVLGVQELKNQIGNEVPVLGWVEAPFQSASLLRNINFFMMDLFDDPDFVHELLNFTTEMALMYGKAQARAGADIVGVGDAVASLISPADYKVFALPYTQRLIQGLKETGVKVKYHICGNSTHLLEQIAQLGADIVNIDAKVDLKRAREVLGNICIKGNLNPVQLIDSTPEEIRRAVRAAMDIGGANYIVSPGCEVPVGTLTENFRAMVKAVRCVK